MLRLIAALLLLPLLAAAQTYATGFGNSFVAMSGNGQFTVSTGMANWIFSGTTGAAVNSVTLESGSDASGSYQQISFRYAVNASSRTGHIRAYQSQPVYLFGVTYNNPSPNTVPFPSFSKYPANLLHMSFNGQFSLPNFPSLTNDSPWIYYDTAGNTFIVSPAANYLTAHTALGTGDAIQTGIDTRIATLPGGFTHWSTLTFGSGINKTFETWGKTLTNLTGKIRPANDADQVLKQISYWTDAGSTFYYKTASGLSYQDTFAALQDDFEAAGIELGSIQLDSWWYPKGPVGGWHSGGGIWSYTASPDLFTPDLATVQKQLGLPLIAHARWIDTLSPLRKQYAVSGNVAIDPKYWEDTAAYFQANGIRTFEQDWLGDKAHADFNLTDPYAFFDNMAASLGKRGITLQYCMATPSQFMQGTNYNNLTTVRTSQDRFSPERWTEFLYSSRFASALGEYPFTDVFLSTEIQNLVFAALSAGPVGIGDNVHQLSAKNLNYAVRADGIIVKPDVPATPLDSVFIADAASQVATRELAKTPMVASTYTDAGNGLRTFYLLAYSREPNPQSDGTPITLKPDLPTDAYLYDFFNNTAKRIPAGGSVQVQMTKGFGYWILAPVAPSGIAVFGDQGHFVTLGKKRIPQFTDTGIADLTIDFAPGEQSRTIFGYSAKSVSATATQGSATPAIFNAATEQFTVVVTRGAQSTVHLRLYPSLAPNQQGCGRPCRIRPALLQADR